MAPIVIPCGFPTPRADPLRSDLAFSLFVIHCTIHSFLPSPAYFKADLPPLAILQRSLIASAQSKQTQLLTPMTLRSIMTTTLPLKAPRSTYENPVHEPTLKNTSISFFVPPAIQAKATRHDSNVFPLLICVFYFCCRLHLLSITWRRTD